MNRILLLEDDKSQLRYLTAKLLQLSMEVKAYDSEKALVDDWEAIASAPPQVAILDIMVRWTAMTKGATLPPEESRDPSRAGLRCAKRFANDPRTKQVALIFYSVLSKGDVDDAPHGTYMVKEHDCNELLEEVQRIILAPRQ